MAETNTKPVLIQQMDSELWSEAKIEAAKRHIPVKTFVAEAIRNELSSRQGSVSSPKPTP